MTFSFVMSSLTKGWKSYVHFVKRKVDNDVKVLRGLSMQNITPKQGNLDGIFNSFSTIDLPVISIEGREVLVTLTVTGTQCSVYMHTI